MEKDNKTEIIPVRMTADLKKDLLKLADKESRPLGNFIRMQLVKVVEQSKAKK